MKASRLTGIAGWSDLILVVVYAQCLGASRSVRWQAEVNDYVVYPRLPNRRRVNLRRENSIMPSNPPPDSSNASGSGTVCIY